MSGYIIKNIANITEVIHLYYLLRLSLSCTIMIIVKGIILYSVIFDEYKYILVIHRENGPFYIRHFTNSTCTITVIILLLHSFLCWLHLI